MTLITLECTSSFLVGLIAYHLGGWVRILIPMRPTVVGCLLLFMVSFLISQISIGPRPMLTRCLHNHCYLPLRAAYPLQQLVTYLQFNWFLITIRFFRSLSTYYASLAGFWGKEGGNIEMSPYQSLIQTWICDVWPTKELYRRFT